MLTDYFEEKQLSDEDRLWNIFWADGRGHVAYKYFHDVVVLDATYLTNR